MMENNTPPETTFPRSKPYTPEEQANYCKPWRALNGGMTRSAFCKKIGISTKTLSRWLSSKGSVSASLGFMPVAGSTDTSLNRLQRIYPNGVKLSVPYCSDKSFQRWIEVLVKCV